MKILAASIGLGVGLLAPPALAGPCSTEIETLTQALAAGGTATSPDAGDHAPAATHLPKAPATSGSLPADPLVPGQPPKVTGADNMPKAPSTAGTLPANPLDSASGDKVTDPGAMPGATAGEGSAAASLQRARQLDQANDEAGCMAEIAKAKALIGTQ
jgi:hypothetical protein